MQIIEKADRGDSMPSHQEILAVPLRGSSCTRAAQHLPPEKSRRDGRDTVDWLTSEGASRWRRRRLSRQPTLLGMAQIWVYSRANTLTRTSKSSGRPRRIWKPASPQQAPGKPRVSEAEHPFDPDDIRTSKQCAPPRSGPSRCSLRYGHP